jgi:hypothetical protein
MKLIFGFILIALGVVVGLWAGVWWGFIGGIVDAVSSVRAPQLDTMGLAMGIAKIIFANFIGFVVSSIAILPGLALIEKG